MSTNYLLLLFLLFLPAHSAVTRSDITLDPQKVSTKVEAYRRDLIVTLLKSIPFRLTKRNLQNFDDPTPLKDDEVMFYLYTQSKPYDSIIINQNLKELNPVDPVKILIHGWTEHYYVEWCRNLTAAYLQKGPYNVIVVDWSSKGDADYLTASLGVPQIGQKVGDFIANKLYKEAQIPLKEVHLISHSLGAHVAGLAGQRVLRILGKKIGRITALDPAAPIFDFFSMSVNDRLSPDDANFVDTIHTDAGFLGFKTSLGVADFYPNGGRAFQPGCSLIKGNIKYEDLFCSHARSHRLFAHSVKNGSMLAHKCRSWELYHSGQCQNNTPVGFGDNAPVFITGNYFLHTPEDL